MCCAASNAGKEVYILCMLMDQGHTTQKRLLGSAENDRRIQSAQGRLCDMGGSAQLRQAMIDMAGEVKEAESMQH